MNPSVFENNRHIVLNDYDSARRANNESFENGNPMATPEYIFPNQKEDALNIMNLFYTSISSLSILFLSILKRTKVGMDGLMIELATIMSTHNHFAIHRNNIFFITGMSNKAWERDLKNKMPACFKENICHHGQLKKMVPKLKNIKNALIIIDEIDSGDKEEQKLHNLLKDSGLLDMKYMEENNIRFVVVSATMINQLQHLSEWGNKHEYYYMTIPENYIGHNEFLERGIIQEFYPIVDDESATKWIREDILQNYGSDYRVHIIRIDENNKHFIENACRIHNIIFKNHTSSDIITFEELSNIFNNITNHVVLAIKGFYRRANIIPNEWKMKIGATHEKYVTNYDTSVQVQGLPGRMTGYWKQTILNGHKTGPHRTSIKSIDEYENYYKNPLEQTRYNTNSTKNSFLTHIKNIEVKQNPSNKRIPVIIDGLNETNILFTKCKQKDKIDFVKLLLSGNEKYSKLLMFINHSDCVQMSQPISDNSYKKHILDVVHATNHNTPYSIDLKKEYKDKNNWQLFIDNREKRICFVIWSINPELY